MQFTENLWINLLVFAIGLAVLIKGSDWFIDGAAYIAKHFNVPDIIIGLTLVSIGTSLPELATNVYSSLNGNPEVSMGVIPGSNVANILLVLGVSVVCMKRVEVTKVMFHRDSMVMTTAFVMFACMCYFSPINVKNADGTMSQQMGLGMLEAIVLLVAFVAYMYFLISHKGEIEKEVEQAEHEVEVLFINSMPRAVFFLFLGGVLVALGAQAMVDNVVWIADEKLHVPIPIITATVVAFGTSVPELAVTLAGVIKKKSDIALGNIVGSSIFNLIFVMGITGLISPVPVGPDVALFILPYMLASGVALVIFMRTGWALVRWEGIVLVLGYISYLGVSVYRAM
ncbi:hypothetical protein BVY04_00615 [bacterium M21]|nr:hypothetical protein BVY04_00615 [bacterium M21]